jgi:rod shape-determining protein MreD
MNGRRRVWLRATLVVAAAVIVQVSLVADLRAAGAIADLVLAVVVAAAITGGPDRAASYGFAAGVAYDLVLDTPFGLTALSYALVGYTAGLVAAVLPRTGGWWSVALAAGAGAAHAGLYTSLGNLVGVPYPFAAVPTVALVMAVGQALVVVPMRRALWWAHGQALPDRLEVLLR